MTVRPTTKHDIQRDDENISQPGFAVVQKILITGSISMLSTGVDAGTGNVTLYVTGTTPYDGWIGDANSWGYVSVDGPISTVDVGTDVTGYIGLGDRLKLTQTTVKYFIVVKLSFSAGITRISLYGGTDYTLVNAAISSVFYSHSKIPFGFSASPAKWTETVTNANNCAKASPTANTWYGGTNVTGTGPSIDVPIGSWNVRIKGLIEVDPPATAGNYGARWTFSTSNNAESDATWTNQGLGIQPAITAAMRFAAVIVKLLEVTSKTTYYLNILTGQVSVTSIAIRGDVATTIIELVCAYL